MGTAGGPPLDRIVAVEASLSAGRSLTGSGYLVRPDLVLTARHCTQDPSTGEPAGPVTVHREVDGTALIAVEVLRSATLDVALLLLAAPGWSSTSEPPSWARVDRVEAAVLTGCHAAGYPRWQLDMAAGQRNLSQFEGVIRTLEDVASGHLVMRDPLLADVALDRGTRSTGGSAWSGLSGAAVLHGGSILGIVTEHHSRQGGAAIQVLPIHSVTTAQDAPTQRIAAELGLAELDALPLAGIRPAGSAELTSRIRRGGVPNVMQITDPATFREVLRAVLDAQRADVATPERVLAGARPTKAEHQQLNAIAEAADELRRTGQSLSAANTYQIGMLAARQRDYQRALTFLRTSAAEDPQLPAPHVALAWLLTSMAVNGLSAREPDLSAIGQMLAEAREAALHTDPVDGSGLALRGFVAKTQAQLARAQRDGAEEDRRLAEATRLFEHAAQIQPGDPSAYNGLGNVRYALGDLDGAITAYRTAVALQWRYAAAHHDLAWALAAKAQRSPESAPGLLAQAIDSLQIAMVLARDDPTFDDSALLGLRRGHQWLEGRLEAAMSGGQSAPGHHVAEDRGSADMPP